MDNESNELSYEIIEVDEETQKQMDDLIFKWDKIRSTNISSHKPLQSLDLPI